MAEFGFSFENFYRNLQNSYSAMLPARHELIGERSTPNVMGNVLELFSVTKRLSARISRALQLEYLMEEQGHTNWREHTETKPEKYFGLMTDIGQFKTKYTFTAAKEIKEQKEDLIETDLTRAMKESAEILGTKKTKKENVLGIRRLQNRIVASMMNSRFQSLDKQGVGERLIPTVQVKKVESGAGNLVNVEPIKEMRGWPICVRAIVSDREGRAIGFRQIKFRKPVDIANPFAKIDWNALIRGEMVSVEQVGLESNLIEIGKEIYYLDEWHKDEIGSPDVVVGLDTPSRRLVDFTHDRRSILMIGIGEPIGETAAVDLISPNHLPNIGMDFVGRSPTASEPDLRHAIFEDVMRDVDVNSLLDDSIEADKLNREYLRKMGEFDLHVSPIKSHLRESMGGEVGVADLRQQMEDVLVFSSLQEYPVLAAFAERVGFYKADKTFELPELLLKQMLDVPNMQYWKDKQVLGVVLPTIAAGIVVDSTMGVDVALKNGDMTLAPLGLDVWVDMKNMLEKLDESESEVQYIVEDKYRELQEYLEVRTALRSKETFREKIEWMKEFCLEKGYVPGENNYDAENFWSLRGGGIVRAMRRETRWLEMNEWILGQSSDQSFDEQYRAYVTDFASLVPTPENEVWSEIERQSWLPIVWKTQTILNIINESKGERLSVHDTVAIGKKLEELYSGWSFNSSLTTSDFTKYLGEIGLEIDVVDDKWVMYEFDKSLLSSQIEELRKKLMRDSYTAYRGVALEKVIEDEIRTHWENGYVFDAKVYSPNTMMPLSNPHAVAEGKRAGSTEVNAELGWMRVLESISRVAGAAGVPSTLRFGGHFSRIVSKLISGRIKKTGMLGTFSSAGGATGTVEVFAQINDMFNFKKIFTQPRNVLKIFLPIIQNDKMIETSFMSYINQLSDKQMSEDDKSLLIEMISNGGERVGRTQSVKSSVRNLTQTLNEEVSTKRRDKSEKLRTKLDVRQKLVENEKASALLNAFEAYARQVESGEYPETDATVKWHKSYKAGGYKAVLDASMEKEIAEFQVYLTGILLIFRRIASPRSMRERNFEDIEAEFKLRQMRFEAIEKLKVCQNKLNESRIKIGRTSL